VQRVFISILTVLLSAAVSAQTQLQTLYSADQKFGQIAAKSGLKPAFLEALADDSIIFQPGPVNGKKFWMASDDGSPARLLRNMIYGDVSSTGAMGFTTGSWELYPTGKPDSSTQFGEYVTIWERKPDGRYRATLDISVSHEKPTTKTPGSLMAIDATGDPNQRGWSAADSALGFLKMGMTRKNLGGAYEKFAADDVRLFIDREMPIIGRKGTVSATKHYNSILFPKDMSLLESGDMAYQWNPCEYANSTEGIEKGNCLQIWKFRNNEWRIVLGVFARIIDPNPPSLKYEYRGKKPGKKD
jgi:ketosteroid isomerase-like protein